MIEKRKLEHRLVGKIQAKNERVPNANMSAFKREIDQLVYKLYDLAPEEISIVEQSTLLK